VTVSGSALPAALAAGFMDEFGDVLYSLYGSTEAGYVAVASPADLRVAPGTAGRPLPLVDVQVRDGEGRPVPPGRTGMIWVSSHDAVAAGGGAVCTGDLGRLDRAGRLFIAGRADDMIVTGGENVYPAEVENVLEQHRDVAEAAVTGRPDPVYGPSAARPVPGAQAGHPGRLTAPQRDGEGRQARPDRPWLRAGVPVAARCGHDEVTASATGPGA
jgi:acyl-CoA synthetase (AMP-forming)/AMP-acid ligase II